MHTYPFLSRKKRLRLTQKKWCKLVKPMLKTIDCHAHLQHELYNDRLGKIIAESREKMDFLLCAGANIKWNRQALEIAEQHKGFIYPYIGLHPMEVQILKDEEFQKELEFIEQNENKIVGIGEVGLDFHWEKDARNIDTQKIRFYKFIELAKKINKPLIIHSWDAELAAVEMLEKHKAEQVMMHCFTGRDALDKALKLGYNISISTAVFFSKDVKKIARDTPIEQILIETDAPYLSPSKPEPNYPWNTALVVKKVAEIKKMEEKELLAQIKKNAKQLFGI